MCKQFVTGWRISSAFHASHPFSYWQLIASIQAGLNLNKEALGGGEKREALQSGWLT